MPTEEPFCGYTLLKVGDYYKENINGYADITVCFIGSIFNLFNILVFTRKNMISPVNQIFTHIAFTDLAVLLAAIPGSFIQRIHSGGLVQEGWTFTQAIISVTCNDLITTFHLVSVFLTVQLTIWRYIAIAHPFEVRRWCHMKITCKVIITGYVMCVFLAIPTYLTREIASTSGNRKPIYTVNSTLFSLSFITYGILGALLPAIVLTVFGLKLLITLLARKSSTSFSNTENNMRSGKTKEVDRSIMILFTILALFLTAEFPRAIIYLLAMIYNVRVNAMNYQCYLSLIQIFNFICYINKSLPFLGYYTMSQQFRDTFKSLFNCSCSSQLESISNAENCR
ncbi:sex peptide receptor-like [Planococcus citri]|uniref:sex peptide receptor-like n=1 Tax=Planococcus citri TaxID=170843 RepID=UPI0031F725DE